MFQFSNLLSTNVPIMKPCRVKRHSIEYTSSCATIILRALLEVLCDCVRVVSCP